MVAYTPTPTGSEDDGGSCDPPSPPSGHSDSPSLESQAARGPGQVGGSALSPPVDKLRGCRGGVHRRLTYDDGGTPQGALQAVGPLLRHPLVVPKPETPVQRWLDDVANMVTAAQRQLAPGGRISATGTSRASTALSSSSAPPPTFGHRRHLSQPPLPRLPSHVRPRPRMPPTSPHPTTPSLTLARARDGQYSIFESHFSLLPHLPTSPLFHARPGNVSPPHAYVKHPLTLLHLFSVLAELSRALHSPSAVAPSSAATAAALATARHR